MRVKITNWLTSETILDVEAESVAAALEAHVEAKKSLRRADLRRADLRRANLSDADLRRADLRRANLSAANLRRANLSAANLRRANLSAADLSAADLSAANLSAANLSDADLSAANLSDANLSAAEIPVVPNLHAEVLKAIEGGQGRLAMSNWHTCETTHCRAGWAVHLAGEAGYALEKEVGSNVAGAAIIMASCPYLEKVPNFYATDAAALADIRACAEREKGIASV